MRELLKYIRIEKLKIKHSKCHLFPAQGLLESPMEKAPVSVACGGESPLDGICLSESDKTAVLTLIREEVRLSCSTHLSLHFFVRPVCQWADSISVGLSYSWLEVHIPPACLAHIKGSLQNATWVPGS